MKRISSWNSTKNTDSDSSRGWLFGLIGMLLTMIGLGCLCASNEESPKRPKKKINLRVVLLGLKGVGKSELWYRLQEKNNPSSGGTSSEEIKEFTLGHTKDGTPINILKTKDIGGGDDYVNSEYDKLIQDGTHVLYLIDLQTMDNNREDNRCRLRKIASSKQQKKKIRVWIVGTFFDKYGINKKIEEAQDNIRSLFRDIKDFDISDTPIHVINTTNNRDILTLKNSILKLQES